MKVLVTGSAGFIGRHVMRRFSSSGARLRGFDLQPPPPAVPGGDDWIVGDINDPILCRKALDGIEAVIHLAADPGVGTSISDPRPSLNTNVFGTFNLLEAAAAARAQRFIFASSGAVLGRYTPPADEATMPSPSSPYGASKLAGEAYCSAFSDAYGVRSLALRFANIYGPDSSHKTSVVASFCKEALAHDRVCIYGDGQQTRDFLFIEDLLDVIVSAVGSDVTGVAQLGSGRSRSVNDLVGLLSGLFARDRGRNLKIEYHPERRGDVAASGYAIARARRLLNFNPRVELADGLAQTWSWFLQTAH